MVQMTDRKPSASLASGKSPLETVVHGLGIPTGIPSATAFHREGEPFLSGSDRCGWCISVEGVAGD